MKSNLIWSVCAANALALFPGVAAAQPTANPSTPEEIAFTDEIIVTAQKRKEALSDVGMSITAATADQLATKGVDNINALVKAVPGLTISRSYGGIPVFALRGIGFVTTQVSAAPTVSVYVDEAPLPYGVMTGGVTLDLERVEILKGPQGTLFGNNATGGSINFIAAKPTDALSSGVRLDIDRFGQVQIEGFVSGALSDTVRVRAAASIAQGGAWQTTFTPGPKIKTGSADRAAARLIVDWEPSPSVKFSLNMNHFYDKSEPQAVQFFKASPSGGPGSSYVDPVYGSVETYPAPPRNNRGADISESSTPFEFDNRFYQAVLRGDVDLSEQWVLTSISQYSHIDYYLNSDQDGTRIDVLSYGSTAEIEALGQELRVAADYPDIGISAMFGANYAKDTVYETQPSTFTHFSILPPGFKLEPFFDVSNETMAAFGNLEWKVTPQLTVLGGARYTRVKQTDVSCEIDSGDGSVAGFFGGLANAYRGIGGLPPTSAYVPGGCATVGPAPEYLPFLFNARSVDHNLSWRAGLNYKPTKNLLLYGLASRGYKAGAYPAIHALVASQYDKVKQEQLTAYEIGTKFSVGRILSVNGAAFYYDYKNKQVFAYTPVPLLGPVSTLNNIPKSKAYGLEGEVTLRPLNGLTLHGAVTHTISKVVDPGNITLNGFGQPIDIRGSQFSYAPKWSGIFDAEFRAPLTVDLEAVVGGNGFFNSAQNGSLDGAPEFAVPSFVTFDLRVGVESSMGWAATAWIRNVSNKFYWTEAHFAGEGYERTTGLPRNFGLTVSYRY